MKARDSISNGDSDVSMKGVDETGSSATSTSGPS